MCLCLSSYLFPDGRTQNPDLTGLCEPSPQDHIKVTQVSAMCFTVHPQSLISYTFLLASSFYYKGQKPFSFFLFSLGLDTDKLRSIKTWCERAVHEKVAEVEDVMKPQSGTELVKVKRLAIWQIFSFWHLYFVNTVRSTESKIKWTNIYVLKKGQHYVTLDGTVL